MPDTAIRTRGLSRQFGDHLAVDGLDLDIDEGSIFGFLGPNGSGKTTTIRMLTGILRPSSGEGRVVGFDLLRDAEEIKRHIGYVAQHFGLYDNLTVIENLEFYARVYHARDPRGVTQLIDRYGFAEYRTTLARDLSGGFRQRLALICALTHAPRLLFLDEPTAGVDPAVRKTLWDFFYELADSGATLFVTTHYMEEAERCDRLAFLDHGRLVAEDSPAGIKRSLADREVFVLVCRYQPALVAKAKALAGIELVNQFGTTLRLVAERGRYDDRSLLRALGLGERTDVAVTRDEPTIEDVFIMLTEGRLAAQR